MMKIEVSAKQKQVIYKFKIVGDKVYKLFFNKLWMICCFVFSASQNAMAVDLECKFSVQPVYNIYRGLEPDKNTLSSENISGVVIDKRVDWDDKKISILEEGGGIATLVVIERGSLSAAKKIIQAGKLRKGRGTCRILGGSEDSDFPADIKPSRSGEE